MIRPALYVSLICLAETLSMTGTMYFRPCSRLSRTEWGLTNTAAGWINGVFFAGYAIASPILGLAVHRSGRRPADLPAFGRPGDPLPVSFWVVSRGDLDGGAPQTLAGIGLAGTYMPGLKALSENVTGAKQSRYIVFYTAAYGGGTALSVYFAGLLEPLTGWRWGAELLALGPLAAMFIFAAVVPPRKPAGAWPACASR